MYLILNQAHLGGAQVISSILQSLFISTVQISLGSQAKRILDGLENVAQ